MDVESCAAAAVLGAVPALGAVGPCRAIPTGHGTRGVLGSVLFCLGDLLAEQGLVLQQLFSSVGKRLAGSSQLAICFSS